MAKQLIKETLIYKKELLLKSAADDALDEREFLFNKTTYDTDGRVISEITFDPEGEMIQQVVFRYNENGYLVEEKSQDADGFDVEHKTFEVTDKGKIAKEYKHYMDGTADTIHYTYNGKDELIKKQIVDPDGDTEIVEEFSYTNGMVSHHVVKDGEGELLSEKKIRYNEKGNPVSIEEYDGSEGASSKKEIEYYPSGNKKHALTYNEDDQLIERILMKEDDKGRLVQVMEETAMKKNTVNFTLNDDGNIVAQEEFDRNGELISKVQRVYDDGKRLLASDVFIHGGGRGLSRNYTLRQEYVFW